MIHLFRNDQAADCAHSNPRRCHRSNRLNRPIIIRMIGVVLRFIFAIRTAVVEGYCLNFVQNCFLRGWRDIVDAMRTCDHTRQAIVKLNMAYVYRLRRAGFLERLGLEFLSKILSVMS